MYQRRISIDEKLARQVKLIAADTGDSENSVIEKAIAFYSEVHFSKNHSTFLNDNILDMVRGMTDRMEMRLNHKTNQLLSELCIELCIMEQVLAASIDVDGDVISEYRKNAVDFLKTNQRVFRMDEIIE